MRHFPVALFAVSTCFLSAVFILPTYAQRKDQRVRSYAARVRSYAAAMAKEKAKAKEMTKRLEVAYKAVTKRFSSDQIETMNKEMRKLDGDGSAYAFYVFPAKNSNPSIDSQRSALSRRLLERDRNITIKKYKLTHDEWAVLAYWDWRWKDTYWKNQDWKNHPQDWESHPEATGEPKPVEVRP